MRWPFSNWLRGGPDRSDAPQGADDPAASPVDTVSGSGAAGRDRDRSPAAWRELPPVQRTVGELPLTAPSLDFARSLAGGHGPAPMLAPLGHDVAADGPVGLVSGIAVPLVQRATGGVDPRSLRSLPAVAPGRARPAGGRVTTVARLPRAGATVDLPAVEAAGAPVDDADATDASAADAGATTADVPAATAAGSTMATDDAAAPTATVPTATAPLLALRRLPVTPLGTGAPALAATRVADASAPPPVVATAPSVTMGASLAESATGPAFPGSPAAVPLTASGVSPASATIVSRAMEPPTAPAQGARAEAQAPQLAAPDPGLPAVARRTLGESRRLGLGAPLAGRPPSAVRESGRRDLPVARLSRSVDAPGALPVGPVTPHPVPAAAEPAPPLPRLAVARRTTAPISAAPGADVLEPPVGTYEDDPLRPNEAASGDAASRPAGRQDGSGAGQDPAAMPRPLVGDFPLAVSRLAREEVPEEADEASSAAPGHRPLDAPDMRSADPGASAWAVSAGSGTPSAGMPGTPAAAAPAEPRTPVVLQRSLPTAARVGPGLPVSTAEAGMAATGRSAPIIAPLVAARPIRAGAAATPMSPGSGAAIERPWAAPISIAGQHAGRADDGPGDDPSPARSGGSARPPADPASAWMPQIEARPVVSRAAAFVDRAPAPVSGSRLPLARSATPAAVAAGYVGAAATGATEAAPARSGSVVGWAADTGFTSVAPDPGPFVQRAVQIDEVSVTPGGDAAGGQSGSPSGGGGQPGPGGAGGAGTDYEELAEHLYERIRARVGAELLLDRERAGMLVDG